MPIEWGLDGHYLLNMVIYIPFVFLMIDQLLFHHEEDEVVLIEHNWYWMEHL
jgi:hypothetical protein